MITLEEIAGYLPYGLKVQTIARKHATSGHNMPKQTGVLHGLYKNYGSEMSVIFREDDSVIDYGLNEIKPIFRPLSDLTREIEHNGEKFVPIVELCKIGSPYKIYEIEHVEIIEDTHALHYRSKGEVYVFGYDNDGFYHKLWTPLHVLKQKELYCKLYEWHFDINGLIERGDAIDINTI